MDNNNEVVSLYLDDIIPNRFQPREVFDDQALKELAVSIKEHGVIQPIIVRKVENKYEIIAGERRYKASTMAGLTKIPAIVKNLDDKESSKVALIENLQRRDLTPIEEARTYQKILELEDNMTQEQLAATMGKTQSSVSNKLRLLALPDEIQDALLKEKISERHARSLLNLDDKNDQIRMMDKVISEKMTVRELDKEIKELKEGISTSVGVENTMPGVQSPADNSGNELLTASDLVAEIPTTPINDIGNVAESTTSVESTTPTEDNGFKFSFSSFGANNNDNTENATSTGQVATEANPTIVDINQVRENSVDIDFSSFGATSNTQPPTTEAPIEEVKEESPAADSSEGFKFVPTSFSFGKADDSNSGQATDVPNKFSQFFNKNINNENANTAPAENNNVASSIPTLGVTVTPKANDYANAVTSIRNVISELKSSGYNVSLEESEDDNGGKFVITLIK